MYYRRKIVLALLDAFGNNLSNIFFQKILFLFCQNQSEPVYNFVPYKYGPFSFQSYRDRRTMIKYGQLANNYNWSKITSSNFINQITKDDQLIISNLKRRFYNFSNSDILDFVYQNYPKYAVKSELNKTRKVNLNSRVDNTNNKLVFFTIGYEGLSIDSFLKKLMDNEIYLICDVRKNPISMKYGFSKNELKNLLKRIKVEYIHIPELGIDSKKRENLNTPQDYFLLFSDYEKNYLPNRSNQLKTLKDYLFQHRRIAITCFESDYKFCHRHKISEALEKNKDWNIPIIHL
ncbi:MAG: DUF488 family protein [Ignavibacteriae bacterium]|nr:DUF488 family protein [Ignavibacteriota bacterium]